MHTRSIDSEPARLAHTPRPADPPELPVEPDEGPSAPPGEPDDAESPPAPQH